MGVESNQEHNEKAEVIQEYAPGKVGPNAKVSSYLKDALEASANITHPAEIKIKGCASRGELAGKHTSYNSLA